MVCVVLFLARLLAHVLVRAENSIRVIVSSSSETVSSSPVVISAPIFHPAKLRSNHSQGPPVSPNTLNPGPTYLPSPHSLPSPFTHVILLFPVEYPESILYSRSSTSQLPIPAQDQIQTHLKLSSEPKCAIALDRCDLMPSSEYLEAILTTEHPHPS